MATVLNAVGLVALEADLLRFHYIATLSLPAGYFGKLMLVLSSLVGLAVVHAGFVVLRRVGKFKARNPSLTRALGMFFMDFFISLVAMFLAPFQCLPSHHEGWALRSCRTVVSWSLADHQAKVAGGLLAFRTSDVIPFAVHLGGTAGEPANARWSCSAPEHLRGGVLPAPYRVPLVHDHLPREECDPLVHHLNRGGPSMVALAAGAQLLAESRRWRPPIAAPALPVSRGR